MEIVKIILVVLGVLSIITLITAYFFHLKNKRVLKNDPLTQQHREILLQHVEFYQNLSPESRKEFEQRVESFLASVHITGVNTKVEEIDKVLIAASAVIPIFGFPGWEYINLREVLLYPDSFNHEFEQKGHERNILGMVGEGSMNRMMILSQQQLRHAFFNKTDKSNTAIHEFVHLLDKWDGAIDGVPESFLKRPYVIPWVQLMRKEIQNIYSNSSDINPYGATNEAEFFAVVSEYFFERPGELQEKHPELYDLLAKIFRQRPVANT